MLSVWIILFEIIKISCRRSILRCCVGEGNAACLEVAHILEEPRMKKEGSWFFLVLWCNWFVCNRTETEPLDIQWGETLFNWLAIHSWRPDKVQKVYHHVEYKSNSIQVSDTALSNFVQLCWGSVTVGDPVSKHRCVSQQKADTPRHTSNAWLIYSQRKGRWLE